MRLLTGGSGHGLVWGLAMIVMNGCLTARPLGGVRQGFGRTQPYASRYALVAVPEKSWSCSASL